MSIRLIQNFFTYHKSYLDQSPQPLKNRKAIQAITACRTREMGVSYYSCDDGHMGIEQHHSCRHRSCFLCAQKKRLEWIEAQKSKLFNTSHYHVIFTLPHEYLSLWRYNELLFSRILFKASQQTLLELLADKKYGGVTPGIVMALHTWGRQLTLHPHTHCLVSGGGLDKHGDWLSFGKYLLPAGVLKAVYRGKLQALLRNSMKAGEVSLPPDMTSGQFWRTYKSLYQKSWCVRVEEKYSHGKGVLLYLARYCKGGPLNPRQIKMANTHYIEMSYLDHRDKRVKRLKLSPKEFFRRLLEHVPPTGVHTIRYYGLYASASKKKHSYCRDKLGCLSAEKVGCSEQNQSVLLYCKACGSPAKLRYQLWPQRRQKGNSIYKVSRRDLAGLFVQQDDECRPGSGVSARGP